MFLDRADAGRRLGERLRERNYHQPVVLALVRGGVPVAYEVARALGAPLDLMLVRKIGHPAQPEYAIGAIVDGNRPEIVLNPDLVFLHVNDEWLKAEEARQLAEIERRRRVYLGGRQRPPIAGKTTILVDDGIATGTTMRAALTAARRGNPSRLVIAVPVAAGEIVDALGREADEIVCLEVPDYFGAVGRFYHDFSQVEDAEVVALLERAKSPETPGSAAR